MVSLIYRRGHNLMFLIVYCPYFFFFITQSIVESDNIINNIIGVR